MEGNVMRRQYALWATVLVTALLAATFWVYGLLPDQVPAHWNAAGHVDRYGPRGWVFVHPLILLGFALAWRIPPAVAPDRFGDGDFASTYWFCGIVLCALLAYVLGMVLWAAHTGTVDMTRALVAGIAIAFVLLGSVLGKVRRNFWFGIRTPWTLADERVWHATHRLAAKTMVGGGLLALALAPAHVARPWTLAILVLAAAVPAAWSRVVHRRLRRTP
jgi:uncharacterized membrane protein